MAKTIVVANQKGGVGKTTTTRNLAFALAKNGKRVLTVDFDSSANLTRCYGIDEPENIELTIAELVHLAIQGRELPDASDIVLSSYGVDFIPTNIRLATVELELKNEIGAEVMLRKVLSHYSEEYDYVLVDTGPSLGILTINAMAAADSIIITVNPEIMAVMGLQDFIRTFMKVKEHLNNGLEIEGLLLTLCDNRTNLSKSLTSEVREAYGKSIRVFETQIPMNSKIGESNLQRIPVGAYSPSAPAAIAYRNLAIEIDT